MKRGSEMGFAVCPSVPSARRLLNAVLMKGKQAIKMHVPATSEVRAGEQELCGE